MSLNRLAVTAAVAATAIGGALACGPDFPWQLLSARHNTMTEPVWFGFAYDSARFLGPTPLPDRLRAVEHEDPQSATEPESVLTERQEAESGAWQALATDLPQAERTAPVFLAKLEAARSASDGGAAEAAGAGLPAAVRLYIAGAVEFLAGRNDTALAYFEAIDGLPADQQRPRAVAAAYMKGRIHQARGEAEPARLAFRAARRAAEAGAPDPMGLAVAAFGEEARVDLVEAGLITPAPWPIAAVEEDDKVALLIVRAVRLYAEQTARESKVGQSSLRQVASLLVDDTDLLQQVIVDPLVRRVLVAYAMSREPYWEGDSTPDVVTSRVFEAAAKLPSPTVGEEIDRLAALAYHVGRYDVAERLTAKTYRPLGLWTRAKLALRRGNRDAAVRDWTAAFTASQQSGLVDDLDETTRVRLRGEAAVARLSAGSYEQALQFLFPTADTYWGDIVYIAERILTVDEMKAFVDGLPPPNPQPAKPATSDGEPPAIDPVERLRGVLARRLVREGRLAESLAYFPTTLQRWDDDPAQREIPMVDEARRYADAVAAAQPGWRWNDITRAEALFDLAVLTRTRGMEVMGTEGPPDLAAVDGAFSFGYGQDSPRGSVDTRDQKDPEDPLLGPDEATRFAASAPKPDRRFHYRVIATDRAIEAADLLPERSQAYAATLCWAARFAFDSNDEERAQSIYRRYVATGPYQAWAKNFGRDCPQPDFDAARDYWPKRIMRLAGQHRTAALAAALGAALLLAASVFAVRRLRA